MVTLASLASLGTMDSAKGCNKRDDERLEPETGETDTGFVERYIFQVFLKQLSNGTQFKFAYLLDVCLCC